MPAQKQEPTAEAHFDAKTMARSRLPAYIRQFFRSLATALFLAGHYSSLFSVALILLIYGAVGAVILMPISCHTNHRLWLAGTRRLVEGFNGKAISGC